MENAKNGYPVFPEVEIYRHIKKQREKEDRERVEQIDQTIESAKRRFAEELGGELQAIITASVAHICKSIEENTAAVEKQTATMNNILRELRGIKGRV